ASGAESVMLRPEALILDPLALVADSLSPLYGPSIRVPSRSISGPLRRNSGISVRRARTEIVVPTLAVTDNRDASGIATRVPGRAGPGGKAAGATLQNAGGAAGSLGIDPSLAAGRPGHGGKAARSCPQRANASHWPVARCVARDFILRWHRGRRER